MSIRKICLVGAVLGTTVGAAANADSTRLRRKIKLDNKGNFRVHLNGGGNLANIQDMVKSIMKTDQPSDVLEMFDGLVSSIVGDALGAVGGRRLSVDGNFLANGGQDRSFKPLEKDAEEEHLFEGDMFDGDMLDGDVLHKSEEEPEKEMKNDRLDKSAKKHKDKKDDRLGKHKENSLKKSLKRETRSEERLAKRAERKDREDKPEKLTDRKHREDREARKEDREAKKEHRDEKHEDESDRMDREKRLGKDREKHMERMDRDFSIGEALMKEDGLFKHTGDRRLRGKHTESSGEEMVSHEVLVSLETLQIVLQEFDTLNVFNAGDSTENRVSTLLTRMKSYLREKLDALAAKKAERQAARDVRVSERTARKEAREDLDFELEIIQKIKTFLDDFSIRGHDLLDFVDRDQPMKVLPSFDRVTASVLDFNDGARNGFLYQKSKTLDKSLGRLSLKYEKHIKLERAPKLKTHRLRKNKQETPVEETEEHEQEVPAEEIEEHQVVEEVEQELAKEKFNKVIVSIANLKMSLLQKEREWGVLREEIEAEIEAVEAEVEQVERKQRLRSRKST